MENKTCGHCKKDKSINNFYKNKQQKSGYDSWCKDCNTEKRIKYRESNKDLIKQKRHEKYLKNKDHEIARNKAYNLKHKEKLSEYAKQYYEDNKTYYKEFNHKWHAENKVEINSKKKEYYLDNKNYILERQKKFYENNKQLIFTRRTERHHQRKKDDAIYALKVTVRQIIRDALRRKNQTKNNKTFNILGCDILCFKTYIESKFDSNMNWENYGSYWWFDHIIPLAEAKSVDEVIKLNHYTNFQPLYWKDNIIKSDNVNWSKN